MRNSKATCLIELRKDNVELKAILKRVKEDLLMRSEEDSEGFKVVDLSSSIWLQLNKVLERCKSSENFC